MSSTITCRHSTAPTHAAHTGRVHRICQADKCIQGLAACPVPQACEVADTTDAGHPGSELGCATSTARFVLLMLAAIAAAALVVELSLRA